MSKTKEINLKASGVNEYEVADTANGINSSSSSSGGWQMRMIGAIKQRKNLNQIIGFSSQQIAAETHFMLFQLKANACLFFSSIICCCFWFCHRCYLQTMFDIFQQQRSKNNKSNNKNPNRTEHNNRNQSTFGR